MPMRAFTLSRLWPKSARIALAASMPCFAGLLASGSCQTSYCSDGDCNPCVQRCACEVEACSSQSAFALERFDHARFERDDGALVDRFEIRSGPSLERAFGAGLHTASDLAALARGVLEYERDLLGAGSAWALASAEIFDTAGVVYFQPESTTASDDPRPISGSSLSCLFDRRGVLLEIERVLAAAR